MAITDGWVIGEALLKLIDIVKHRPLTVEEYNKIAGTIRRDACMEPMVNAINEIVESGGEKTEEVTIPLEDLKGLIGYAGVACSECYDCDCENCIVDEYDKLDL